MFRKSLKPVTSLPSDSSMASAVDPQKSLQLKTVHGCVPVRAAHLTLHLRQQVHLVCENDGMCNPCVTLGGQLLSQLHVKVYLRDESAETSLHAATLL